MAMLGDAPLPHLLSFCTVRQAISRVWTGFKGEGVEVRDGGGNEISAVGCQKRR